MFWCIVKLAFAAEDLKCLDSEIMLSKLINYEARPSEIYINKPL